MLQQLLRISVLLTGLCMSLSANAALILTLTDDGLGGTTATFSGSGTTTGGLGNNLNVGTNIGEYVAAGGPNNDHFDLASAVSFGNGRTLTELYIDIDNGIDDFHIDTAGGGIGSNFDYSVDASTAVVGLSFADLVIGTYAGTGRESRRLGGFTLIIADSAAVPAPATLFLLGTGLALLGLRRKA